MQNPESGQDFESLLEFLKRNRGFDFTGYKRSTLRRRIAKRMQAVGMASYASYMDFLEVHPEEFAALFDTVLINVTGFFRDPDTWELLRREVIPSLIAAKPADQSIRVWSAGCASGEEAYSLAILFAEALGEDAFHQRMKIYATDADESALAHARLGTYTARQVEAVPADLLERYFESMGAHFQVRKDVRRQVIFGRHDLIQDAPISRVDMLVCRNTLMYFNSETQARILARFHFALNEGGILFLGRAETLLTRNNHFRPVDLKRRISAKIALPTLRDQLLLMSQAGADETMAQLDNHRRARDAALDASPVAQLVVDPEGALVFASERARTLFGISTGDIGRPLQDLTVSYKPVELRSRIEETMADRRPTTLKEVEWPHGAGEVHWFDIQFAPLVDVTARLLGTSVTFTDVTGSKRLRRELEHANQELESAYEELQATNEELETTNEELQSTVEELETTNEELQSSNEELETMNEELHSTNEELQTINDEVRQRSDELNQANSLLEAILRSFRGGVVVVDRELHVLLWNDMAEELWGLRRAEVVGKNFLNLDIGLPLEQLRAPLRAALGDAAARGETTIAAVNRRGRSIQVLVSTTPLVSADGGGEGVILTMEDSGATTLGREPAPR
ncbi:MAG TPA: CheR family methyltransferase [Gemmatimonadaceae bacterium]|nr:CheR family methyltransferase [Gemmatimonadaceae bacterium]